MTEKGKKVGCEQVRQSRRAETKKDNMKKITISYWEVTKDLNNPWRDRRCTYGIGAVEKFEKGDKVWARHRVENFGDRDVSLTDFKIGAHEIPWCNKEGDRIDTITLLGLVPRTPSLLEKVKREFEACPEHLFEQLVQDGKISLSDLQQAEKNLLARWEAEDSQLNK